MGPRLTATTRRAGRFASRMVSFWPTRPLLPVTITVVRGGGMARTVG